MRLDKKSEAYRDILDALAGLSPCQIGIGIEEKLHCSVCGNVISDMCQAHYIDGPICTPCLFMRLEKPVEIPEPDWAERGCW